VTPAEARPPAATDAATLPAGVTQEMVAKGEVLFNTGSCQRCHSRGGTGGQNGPSLVVGSWLHQNGTFEAIVNVVRTGIPLTAVRDPSRRFAMNPRGGPMNLSAEQTRDVAAYVWSISRRKTSR
jgi:mono/diheme cytochrome c family protein